MAKQYAVYKLLASGFESESEAWDLVNSDPDFDGLDIDLVRVVEM
jgi:hypothetical protein